jgi:hypothetical protein
MNRKNENSNSAPQSNPQPPAQDNRVLEESRPETPVQNASSAHNHNGSDPGGHHEPAPKPGYFASPDIFVSMDDCRTARELQEYEREKEREQRGFLVFSVVAVFMLMLFGTVIFVAMFREPRRRQQVVVTLPDNQGVLAVDTPPGSEYRPQVVAYYPPRRPLRRKTTTTTITTIDSTKSTSTSSQ